MSDRLTKSDFPMLLLIGLMCLLGSITGVVIILQILVWAIRG